MALFSDNGIIHVDPSQIHSSDIMDVFQLKGVLNIEVTENSLLNRIEKVISLNDSYFVMDREVKKIIKIDKNGQMIDAFFRAGKGPGELPSIFDFTVAEEDSIVFILGNKKLLKFDTGLNFIEEYALDILGYRVFALGRDQLLYYVSPFDPYYQIYKLDLLLNKKKGLINRPNNWGKIGGFPLNVFSDYEGHVNINQFYSDTIYAINKNQDSLSVCWQFDFGEYNLPYEVYFRKSLDFYDMSQIFVKTKKAYRFDNFRETSSFIYFTYCLENNHINHVIYNKTKKQVLQNGPITGFDDDDFRFRVIGNTETDLIVAIPAFLAQSFILTNKIQKHKPWSKLLETPSLNISEDSNPLLLTISIRD